MYRFLRLRHELSNFIVRLGLRAERRNVLFRPDWNWLEAQREFNRGLALDEYSPMAHWYMTRLVMAMGAKEYALNEMKKASLLDPSFDKHPGRPGLGVRLQRPN